MSVLVKCADFDAHQYFKQIRELRNRRGNPSGKKRHYLDILTAFDIETSYLADIKESVMYIWQWQIGLDYTVIGRTWDEFLIFQLSIKEAIPPDLWVVVYVHNLAFEFQFLKGVYQFLPGDVFALASRKPLTCDMHGCFEFRCSAKLTNMSLDAFTHKMGVEHQKLSGEEFDYSKVRYPWTELTARELEYCTNDVLGLVEAVQALMDRDGDTIQTIPLTSTGYVRREAKRALKSSGKVHHNFLPSILPDLPLYIALREAFRGGDTHANRYYSDEIIPNVHSADRSSSYPAVMCNCLYPMSVFVPIKPHNLTTEYITRCITIRHKALLLRIKIEDLALRDPFWGCPYLSESKCRNVVGASSTLDNGRILSADSLETTVTDIDLHIITETYTGKITFLAGWYSSYKPLPEALIKEVISYYKAKTSLKGVEGQELYYEKMKALLNALYGMMAQDPVKRMILFKQIGDWDEDTSKSVQDILYESNRKAFLAYQWGVWVTAHARFALYQGIKLVHQTPGAHFVYCDTDSVKYTGDVDWTPYNTERIKECQASGAYADDPSGTTHYMGVFEKEGDYHEFKTLGAKKYAYTTEPSGKCKVTVAGVSKQKGGAELDAHGGLPEFSRGLRFVDAGGTCAVYDDDPEIHEIQVDGHTLPITANVSILPSEYTLSLDGEYLRIIKFAKSYLENGHIL